MADKESYSSDRRLLAPHIVDSWAVRQADKLVLLNGGLPREVPPFFEASIQNSSVPQIQSTEVGALYEIGTDGGSQIGISAENGEIYSISPYRGYTAFVNSDLERFSQFLDAVLALQGKYSTMTDEEMNMAAGQLKERLRSRDTRAIADPSCWWSLVFEQMEAGLI